MPRVAGLNLVAVLVATVAFYLVGMVIYGFTLMEMWANETLKNHGLLQPNSPALSGQELMAKLGEIPGSLSEGMAYGLGFLLTLVTTTGIALVLNMTRPASLGAALGRAFVLWLCFGAMTLTYNVIYSSESTTIYMIDLMHLFLGYHLAAAVLFLMDGKAIRSATAPAAA
jgi:Protein of unknown function (DUF1761)